MRPKSRSGFALLAVLWVLTTLTVLSGVTVAVARTGAETTRNRILLARAGWAREACAEIALARYAQEPSARGVDTVDLGRGTWCRAGLTDAGSKLNLNLAAPAALRAVLVAFVRDSPAADSLVRALDVARRHAPFVDVHELGAIPGFDSSIVARLTTVLTTRGSGSVDLNSAPAAVLAAVPGLTTEAVTLLLGRRSLGLPVQSADELTSLLPEGSRAALLGAYREFTHIATFRPQQFLGIVEGGVRGTPITARVTMTLVPAGGRLAVVRRETE